MEYNMVKKASEVRANFRGFLDEVIRERPAVIERYGSDPVFALSHSQMEELLHGVKLTLEYELEDDGTVSGSLNELPIVENGADLCSLKLALAHSAIEYVNAYMEGYQRYSVVPSMKEQFPYVMKILIQNDVDAVVDLIHG